MILHMHHLTEFQGFLHQSSRMGIKYDDEVQGQYWLLTEHSTNILGDISVGSLGYVGV